MPPDDVIDVPYVRLAPETLRAVIEEFVTRDTTDYGAYAKSLDEKVADVMRQLKRAEAKILSAPEEQRVHIVSAHR